MTSFTLHDLPLPGGGCPVHVLDKGKGAPALILFMDAFGPRPALFDIGEQLSAAAGCSVVLAQLFYRHLPFKPFDPASLAPGSEDFRRLMGMFGSLTQEQIDTDVEALLAFAGNELGAEKMAAVGFCMGGRYALAATTSSERLLFAASIHGSMLAPDQIDSVHHRLRGLKARIYVGVAGTDPMFDGAEEGRLVRALREGGVDHAIETYAGAHHGFAMRDLPVHDSRSAGRMMRRLEEEIGRAFQGE